MLVLPDKFATCKEVSSSFGFCATWISFFNGSQIRRVNAYIYGIFRPQKVLSLIFILCGTRWISDHINILDQDR